MDEVIRRGPQRQHTFSRGSLVGEHSARAFRDGPGREVVLEDALPPQLSVSARVRRVSRVWTDALRRPREEGPAP